MLLSVILLGAFLVLLPLYLLLYFILRELILYHRYRMMIHEEIRRLTEQQILGKILARKNTTDDDSTH